jgi:GTPase SAR1 family protein
VNRNKKKYTTAIKRAVAMGSFPTRKKKHSKDIIDAELSIHCDFFWKIRVVGGQSCGKTNLVLRAVDNYFTFAVSEIWSIGNRPKTLTVGFGKYLVKLELLDTKEEWRPKSFFEGVNGVIVAFDLNEPRSWDSVRGWVQEAFQYSKTKVFIVGLKLDLERTVSQKTVARFLSEFPVEYCEASAKTGEGVDEIFSRMALSLVEETEKVTLEKDKLLAIAWLSKNIGTARPIVCLYLTCTESHNGGSGFQILPEEVREYIFELYLCKCVKERPHGRPKDLVELSFSSNNI